MTDHPITPPPELIRKWLNDFHFPHEAIHLEPPPTPGLVHMHIATKAAQWGFNQHQHVTDAQLQEVRDQELEACAEWVANTGLLGTAKNLRAARRPKPPSLKERALEALETEDDSIPLRSLERGERFALIRRALETIPDETP